MVTGKRTGSGAAEDWEDSFPPPDGCRPEEAAGLVSAAAAVLPDVVAVDQDGAVVTFLDLEASAVAMATALPDTDAGTALVVALTSLVPTLTGSDGSDGDPVEVAVDAIARRAAELVDAVGGGSADLDVTFSADGAESA